MPTVFANGRSILHKGDGNTHVAAPPDVCKVPTPGGPVPTPFVNTASDSMLSKASKKTKIEGNPIAISDSEISMSSGDEPGTLGGLVSSKFKGKLTWSGASTDVKCEGKGVVRFMDPTGQNGNTFNTAFISQGETGLAFGDDMKCPLTSCGDPTNADAHRLHETTIMVTTLSQLQKELDDIMDAPIPGPFGGQIATLAASDPQLAAWCATNVTPGLSQRSVVQAIARLGVIAYGQSAPIAPNSVFEQLFTALKSAVDASEGRQVLKKMPLSRFAIFHAKVPSFTALKLAEASGAPPGYTVPLAGFVIGAASCLNCDKTFVSHSGTFPSDGFDEAQGKLPGNIVFVPPKPNKFDQNPAFANSATKWTNNWSCAASHLLDYMKQNGHAPRSMSERFYSPLVYLYKAMGTKKTPDIQSITGGNPQGNSNKLPAVSVQGAASLVANPVVHRPFVQALTASSNSKPVITVLHGESMSSCETCQEFLPALLCPPRPNKCAT